MSINNYCKNCFTVRFLAEEVLGMRYKYNVSCSETNSKNWTPTAVDCYLLGCACSKCYLNKVYFIKSGVRCRMKETVIELVRRLGIPQESDYEY